VCAQNAKNLKCFVGLNSIRFNMCFDKTTEKHVYFSIKNHQIITSTNNINALFLLKNPDSALEKGMKRPINFLEVH